MYLNGECFVIRRGYENRPPRLKLVLSDSAFCNSQTRQTTILISSEFGLTVPYGVSNHSFETSIFPVAVTTAGPPTPTETNDPFLQIAFACMWLNLPIFAP